MTPLETRLARSVRRFDPICLLDLLGYLGYRLDDILFRSHFSACSQASLVEAIEFRREPRQAIVTLNLGFLGGQSALPSYFFKLMHHDLIESRRFVQFFGYFDDRVLRRHLLAVYPEIDPLYSDWETRKRDEIQTLKLDSVAALHWLAQLVFPELQARVEKATLTHTMELGAPVLGKTRLGYRAVFGKKVDLPVPGRRLTLIADEENCATGRPWPREIEQRLQQLLFPLLRRTGLELEIWLIVRTRHGWLRLDRGSYLGYEGMQGGDLRFRRIRIFVGRLLDWH